MEAGILGGFKADDLIFLAVTAAVAAGTSLLVFTACFYWFRQEQRRTQKKQLRILGNNSHGTEELILTGRDAAFYGELVAQFKVNHGRQVVSVLESEGKRFIHVDGELSPLEREKMVSYLKAEGFMS